MTIKFSDKVPKEYHGILRDYFKRVRLVEKVEQAWENLVIRGELPKELDTCKIRLGEKRLSGYEVEL